MREERSNGRHAVFLDRDGTINEDLNYVSQPKDFRLLPGALEALKTLHHYDIQIYIITNQGGIAKGFYTEADFNSLTSYMLSMFQEQGVPIEEVLYCPHHPDGMIARYRKKCDCRKPESRLIREIMSKRQLSSQNVALIGDKNSDIMAGHNLHLMTYLVETGYGKEHKGETLADYVVPDLQAAVEHLVQQWKL